MSLGLLASERWNCLVSPICHEMLDLTIIRLEDLFVG